MAEAQTEDTSQAVAVKGPDNLPDTANERPIDVFKRQLKKSAAMIMPLLPAHLTEEKFTSMVVTAVAFNPKLQNCSMPSLLRAVAEAAELGLSLNRNLKEADILPVWSKDGDVAQLRPRYNGLMKLARQSGEIIDIYAHEVYEADHFKYELGLNKVLEHRPAEGDRGALTYAYVVWETKLHVRGFEVIDKKRITRAKAASEGFKAFKAGKIKSTPWDTDESEMWRKTAVHAGSKYMPQSTENDAFQRALNLADPVEFEDEAPAQIGEQRVIPPRPTRQAEKEVAEEVRQGGYEMDRQFRDTMRDDVKAEETKPEAEPAEPTMTKSEALKYGPAIKKAIVAADTFGALSEVANSNSEAMTAIEHHLPILFEEITGMYAAKRDHLTKK